MKPMMFYLPDCLLYFRGCVASRTIEDVLNGVASVAVPSDTDVISILMYFLYALPWKFLVSVDLSHGEGLKLVKMTI